MPRLIVIGTSAGGIEALRELVAQLPSDFPCAIVYRKRGHSSIFTRAISIVAPLPSG
jgi:two-component system, chemotaxis family, protein-glutamate methylesterase/glutaminase